MAMDSDDSGAATTAVRSALGITSATLRSMNKRIENSAPGSYWELGIGPDDTVPLLVEKFKAHFKATDEHIIFNACRKLLASYKGRNRAKHVSGGKPATEHPPSNSASLLPALTPSSKRTCNAVQIQIVVTDYKTSESAVVSLASFTRENFDWNRELLSDAHWAAFQRILEDEDMFIDTDEDDIRLDRSRYADLPAEARLDKHNRIRSRHSLQNLLQETQNHPRIYLIKMPSDFIHQGLDHASSNENTRVDASQGKAADHESTSAKKETTIEQVTPRPEHDEKSTHERDNSKRTKGLDLDHNRQATAEDGTKVKLEPNPSHRESWSLTSSSTMLQAGPYEWVPLTSVSSTGELTSAHDQTSAYHEPLSSDLSRSSATSNSLSAEPQKGQIQSSVGLLSQPNLSEELAQSGHSRSELQTNPTLGDISQQGVPSSSQETEFRDPEFAKWSCLVANLSSGIGTRKLWMTKVGTGPSREQLR